jgi:hypothetical protein
MSKDIFVDLVIATIVMCSIFAASYSRRIVARLRLAQRHHRGLGKMSQ